MCPAPSSKMAYTLGSAAYRFLSTAWSLVQYTGERTAQKTYVRMRESVGREWRQSSGAE